MVNGSQNPRGLSGEVPLRAETFQADVIPEYSGSLEVGEMVTFSKSQSRSKDL